MSSEREDLIRLIDVHLRHWDPLAAEIADDLLAAGYGKAPATTEEARIAFTYRASGKPGHLSTALSREDAFKILKANDRESDHIEDMHVETRSVTDWKRVEADE